MSVLVETIEEKEVGTEAFVPYAIVTVNHSGGLQKEAAEVISMSSGGAGFYLSTRVEPGQLVSALLPLEPEFRTYGKQRELFPVWGLIQHCHKTASTESKRYHVGIAFIGKHAPESFNSDPRQSFQICGMSEDGLWTVKETGKSFKARRDTRFHTSIDLYLAVIDGKQTAIKGERTTTENISRGGAAVVSTLDVSVGDRVKFISEKFDFSGLAVICNRQPGHDGRSRLHLQFVENQFPVESIKQPASNKSTRSQAAPEKTK